MCCRDDMQVVIGSANLNDRSMKGDGDSVSTFFGFDSSTDRIYRKLLSSWKIRILLRARWMDNQ